MSLAEPLIATAPPRDSFFAAATVCIGTIVIFTGTVSTAVVLFLPAEMVSLSVVAYCFGCRHGVDADHIAAIDNVTRRMVATGRRPMTVGLFFSLGHCTVVLMLCCIVLASADITSSQLDEWASMGSAVGPWAAAAVLLCIGTLNICVARDLLAQWRMRTARGHQHEIASLVGQCCPTCMAGIDQPCASAAPDLSTSE